MLLTGQPLVDLGLAVATLHAKKRSVSDVNETDLQSSVQWLNARISPEKSNLGAINALRILSAYWQNNPLAGKNMGTEQTPYQNVPSYRRIIENLISGTPKTRKECCQICGRNEVYIDVNRSWFPLASSSESDPCSLPGLRGKLLCASCFCAIILIPLGCKFVGSNPYFFHLTDPELLCEANEIGISTIQRQIVARATGNNSLKTEVKLSGRVALLEIVSGSSLWDSHQGGKLSRRASNGATIIAFNNGGTSAAWYQLHLPAQALDFFAELDSEKGLKNTFLQWAQSCDKSTYLDKTTKAKRSNSIFGMLCDDVEQRRSIGSLLRVILRRRNIGQRVLTREEKKVLEIYESVALGKQQRFETLERIAGRINAMEEQYRNSFVKQLANIRRKDTLLALLVKYAQSEKTSLRITREELQVLDSEKSNEVISLLYLLCVAEKENKI